LRRINVSIPEELAEFLHYLKRKWGLRTLDDTVTVLLTRDMQRMKKEEGGEGKHA